MRKIISAVLAAVLVVGTLAVCAISSAADEKITVDGDLSDWGGIATIELKGDSADTEHNSGNKSATFYAYHCPDGLYVAVEAYHDVYASGEGEWWRNTNLEFFQGKDRVQEWVNAGPDGTTQHSGNVSEAVMVTETLNDAPTKYHTVAECFIPADKLNASEAPIGIEIGVAFKTIGDLIIGGAAKVNEDGSDEYWVPENSTEGYNSWPNAKPMVATMLGLYWADGLPTDVPETTEPAEPTEPAETSEPTEPAKTGSAAIVIAAVSVIALAGAVIASKKRG